LQALKVGNQETGFGTAIGLQEGQFENEINAP